MRMKPSNASRFRVRSGIVQPSDVRVTRDGDRVTIQWNTALAGPEPLRSYEILAGNRLLLSLPFRPQLTEAPLAASLPGAAIGADTVTVVASVAPPRRPA